MKLSLVLLLVLASVALFKAEELPEDVEELNNDEESSVSFLYDGSMEDEVMGDEEDPHDKAKKMALLRRIGDMVSSNCGGKFFFTPCRLFLHFTCLHALPHNHLVSSF